MAVRKSGAFPDAPGAAGALPDAGEETTVPRPKHAIRPAPRPRTKTKVPLPSVIESDPAEESSPAVTAIHTDETKSNGNRKPSMSEVEKPSASMNLVVSSNAVDFTDPNIKSVRSTMDDAVLMRLNRASFSGVATASGQDLSSLERSRRWSFANISGLAGTSYQAFDLPDRQRRQSWGAGGVGGGGAGVGGGGCDDLPGFDPKVSLLQTLFISLSNPTLSSSKAKLQVWRVEKHGQVSDLQALAGHFNVHFSYLVLCDTLHYWVGAAAAKDEVRLENMFFNFDPTHIHLAAGSLCDGTIKVSLLPRSPPRPRGWRLRRRAASFGGAWSSACGTRPRVPRSPAFGLFSKL